LTFESGSTYHQIEGSIFSSWSRLKSVCIQFSAESLYGKCCSQLSSDSTLTVDPDPATCLPDSRTTTDLSAPWFRNHFLIDLDGMHLIRPLGSVGSVIVVTAIRGLCRSCFAGYPSRSELNSNQHQLFIGLTDFHFVPIRRSNHVMFDSFLKFVGTLSARVAYHF
jgi:hypothetical protein